MPENKRADQLIEAVVNLIELVFPGRVRACYLVGSYAEGTAVPHSDLDLIVIFKGSCLPGEADPLRQLRQIASQLAAMRLDLAPRCEADLLAKGSTGLKLGGKFVSGEDILDQIPWEPIEQYQQDSRQGFMTYQHQIRGEPELLPRPVTFPDADGEFFGYEKFGIWLGGDRFAPGTRLLLNLVSLGATVSLAFLHGARAGSKRQAIEKYQQLIGDEWGDWLAELYQLAKVDLGYEIPGDTAVRLRLRTLVQKTPDFENLVWSRCNPA
ncbi:MAG: nucleotidyltransferase domain-containing protein [Anaerolineaceae bacterium]|nr:nucleotidyltransferase domain-containing protein [Anaerolineaceae bacterium]